MQSTLHKVVCYLTSTVCFIDFDSFGMFLLFKNEGLCVCLDVILCSVQEYDNGSYFCRASNIHLQRFLTSRRATLTVLGMTSQ